MAEKPKTQTSKETEAKLPTSKETEKGKEPLKKVPEPGDQLPPAPVDYKKKFTESKQGALELREENKRLQEKNDGLEVKLAEANTAPSDEELSKRFPDWEFLDETEKTRLRREESLAKRIKKLEEDKVWKSGFQSLIAQEPFASLKDREVEIKTLAQENPNTKLEILAQSLLFSDKKKAEEVPPKRKGLETPTSGRDIPPTEPSLADIKNLREQDPKRYAQLLREGKLNKIPEK